MAAEGNNVDLQAAVGKLLVKFRDTVCKKYAAKAEQIAREQAPWTDRTGNARKLLKGDYIDDGESLGFSLAHRVEYGKYLETANDGKYAVLKPTIEFLREGFLEAARQTIGGRG